MTMFRMTPLAAAVLAVYAVPGLAQHLQQDANPPVVAAVEGASSTVAAATADANAVVLPTMSVEGQAQSRYRSESSSSKYIAPLRDTAKSVTIISSQVLQDNAATSLQDALRTVPGITFLAGEGGQPIGDRPVLRGLASANSLFIDGIRDIGSQTRDVFALDSIEVTKGADSAFGGRGSGGGSINLVTKQARIESFGAADISIGSSDTLRGTLDNNWVINDSTAARLNVLGNRGNVPGRDNAVGYDKWGVAGALAFGLGTPTRITLDYYHLTDNGMPDYSIPYDLATGEPVTETLGVNAKNFYGLANRDFRDSDTDTATVSIAHDLDGGLVLRNVTRYGQSLNSYVVSNPDDSSGNVANGLVYRSPKTRWSQTDVLADTVDITGGFATGFVGHRFNSGVEFSREKRDQDSYLVTRVPAGTARVCTAELQASFDCTSLNNPNPNDAWAGTVRRANAPTDFTTEAIGLYGFDTLTLAPQWLLNLGLRYDSYDTKATRPAGSNSAGTAVTALSASIEDSFINYQLGLIFKPVEAGSLYVSYSTESTPSAIGTGDEDAVTTLNATLKPEQSRTAEIGAKWELFHQRLLISGAVFDNQRKNASIALDANTTQQVGKTHVRGAELSVSGSVTADWQVIGGYSYLDSELVRGALYATPPSKIIDSAQGKVLPNTPENSLSLFTTYRLMDKATIGGGAYYVSKVYGNTSTTINTTTNVTSVPKFVPDYWRFDATAAYDFTPRFKAQINLQNLTDKVFYTKAYTSHYAALGTGRQLLLSLNLKF